MVKDDATAAESIVKYFGGVYKMCSAEYVPYEWMFDEVAQ